MTGRSLHYDIRRKDVAMKTRRLYHENSYLQEFDAQVVEIIEYPKNRYGVVLNQTAFYPESGGQPYDTGVLQDIPVIEVRQQDDTIIHIVEQRPNAILVTGKINWSRRFDHMQQHSGEHILSGAFLDLFGVYNIGFHLGDCMTTIDLAIDALTDQQIEQAEQRANEIVFANRPIHCSFIDKEQLTKLKLRKELTKPYDTIRIVDMDGFDCCPCGGTHTASTGEVGLIKIRSWERIKTGVRIEVLCGLRALTDYQLKNKITNILSTELSVTAEHILPAFNKQSERLHELNKELVDIKKIITKHTADKLISQAEVTGGIRIICFSEQHSAGLNQLASMLTAHPKTIALLGATNPETAKSSILFACSPDIELHMGAELKAALQLVSGKGGGSAQHAQGGFAGKSSLDLVLEQAKHSILMKCSPLD